MGGNLLLYLSLLAVARGSGIPPEYLPYTGFLKAGGSSNITEYASHPILYSSSMEFILPAQDHFRCFLPNLRRPIEGLSIDFVDKYLVECVDYECWRLIREKWVYMVTLRESRRYHTSTVVGNHLLLVGGQDSPETAELVPMDGGFSQFHFILYPPRSHHCSIDIEDNNHPDTLEVILTGGQNQLRDTFRNVEKYWDLGSERDVKNADLPPLITGRMSHACGWYKVESKHNVLIVAGGWHIRDGKWTLLSSTEIFHPHHNEWVETTELPSPRTLIGGTLGNCFYAFDAYSRTGLQEEILQWNKDEQLWYQAESPIEDREYSGYAKIKVSDIFDLPCTGNPPIPVPEPVDGGFGKWTSWSTCTRTCGTGDQKRTRLCNSPAPANGGRKCIGSYLENQKCNKHKCPVDGGFNLWSEWSGCSRTCGTGQRSQKRLCNNPTPSGGGKPCIGEFKRFEPCNKQFCPVDGGFGPWTVWGVCSKSCGSGNQDRSRKCNNPAPAHGGDPCLGDFNQNQICNSQPCPVHGGYSQWSKWTTCSKTCGSGKRARSRQCDNPKPQHGGNGCAGEPFQEEFCNQHNCPVDGVFGQWTHWSSCTKTCGTGSRDRTRDCDSPAPEFGGKPCSGNFKQQEDCNTNHCPGAGNWGLWTSWSQCPVTCGTGWHTRDRFCDNPPPTFGGQDCEGKKQEKGACNTQVCPIDGQFGHWSHWGGCSKTCGTGSRSRDRKCDSPAPQHGGKSCFGNFQENEDCNTNKCPENGAWGQWFPWTHCDKSCGTGWQIRHRLCDDPLPSFGGADCQGNKQEKAACNTQLCPVNGGFSQWTEWTHCDRTCAGGKKNRRRQCTNPFPSNGGAACEGQFEQTEFCNNHIKCW